MRIIIPNIGSGNGPNATIRRKPLMKKIFALVLALMLAMGACSAFAEDAIIIGISGPLTGP